MQQQMQPQFTRNGGNRLRTLKRCKRRQLLYFLYNVRSILCKLKKKAKDVGDREKMQKKKCHLFVVIILVEFGHEF